MRLAPLRVIAQRTAMSPEFAILALLVLPLAPVLVRLQAGVSTLKLGIVDVR